MPTHTEKRVFTALHVPLSVCSQQGSQAENRSFPLTTLRSLWIWFAIAVLIISWLPLLAIINLFDRDEVRYRTGRWFRRLGVAMTKVNPSWKLEISGHRVTDPRRPYVVVSNHQSLADIPLISHLPWEMKWVAKAELFRLPFVGWMMKIARDIPVDRGDTRSGATMLLHAGRVLQRKCGVMFFPEGTRSPDGRVGRFTEGAFHLALRAQVPILPVVVEGSHGCLPKKSWRFGGTQQIRLKVLPPVETRGMSPLEAPALRDTIRNSIIAQIAEWRAVAPETVDALAPRE